MEENKPAISISTQSLTDTGYTKSGSDQYIKTVQEYGQLVFNKAITYSEVDKAPNESREVTHEHVKASAHSIANSYGKPLKPKWVIPAQLGQYVCAGVVGLGAAQMDKTTGIIEFVGAFVIGGVLFIIEKTYVK